MNLVIASGLVLLVMLVSQPTMIYGNSRVNGRKHSTLASTAKLVMETKSGDVLVRSARGAVSGVGLGAGDGSDIATPAANNGGSTGKRSKNSNNNKKLNKNLTSDSNAPHTGRKHTDKKFTAALNQQQQPQQQHHAGNSGNKGNKQRQMLKSQQHQEHGKRSGSSKTKSENGEKPANGEKSPSTCRYAKSAWSECDAKTNMRSRTLTLKKGEANCLPTRTMQKKCKKACRYEKGSWSQCNAGQMTRQDKLKSTGSSLDTNCEAIRTTNKKCNPGGGGVGKQPGGKVNNKERKNKDKASRRAPQQA